MFDPNKPVQTRDGRKARIICTDRNSDYPIVALLAHASGNESCEAFASDGSYTTCGECGADLINIPDVKYLNVYEHSKYSPGCAANYPPSKLFDSCNEARSAAINMKAKGIKVLLEAHPIEV